MTIQETAQIMDILAIAYPQFYNGKNAVDPAKALQLWAGMFADDPADVVAAAVKAFIATNTSGFPPSIGEIREKIRMLTEPEEQTEAEAWAIAYRALRNSVYGAKEEFDKLPEDIQKLVGSPYQLKEWALMDADSVQSVVASNFQRSFRAKKAREREVKALPSDVRKLLCSASEKMLLPKEPCFEEKKAMALESVKAYGK